MANDKNKLAGFENINTHLKKRVLEEYGDNIDVEIGDEKQTEFYPQVKLKRWDNEANLSVRLDDDFKGARLVEDGNKIKLKGRGKEVNFYEIDEGFEFEVVFARKPKTNVVNFTIQTKGLRFLYQPEIEDKQAERRAKFRGVTIEEARRQIRPENVVGSYAVYHDSKSGDYSPAGGKNYRAGKAYHIYRPKIIDKSGDWVWGVLNVNVDSGLLTVTIPQEFLDKAVYPLTVDPTFGYTSVGGSQEYTEPDWMIGDRYTVPSDTNKASSISVYIQKYYASESVKGVLYSGANVVSNGVGGAVAAPASFGWVTSTFSTSPSLTPSTDYGICWISNSYPDYKYDTDAGAYQLFHNNNSYASPAAIPTDDVGSWKHSLYCTYTAGTASNDERAAKLTGKDTDNDIRSAHMYGGYANTVRDPFDNTTYKDGATTATWTGDGQVTIT